MIRSIDQRILLHVFCCHLNAGLRDPPPPHIKEFPEAVKASTYVGNCRTYDHVNLQIGIPCWNYESQYQHPSLNHWST